MLFRKVSRVAKQGTGGRREVQAPEGGGHSTEGAGGGAVAAEKGPEWRGARSCVHWTREAVGCGGVRRGSRKLTQPMKQTERAEFLKSEGSP